MAPGGSRQKRNLIARTNIKGHLNKTQEKRTGLSEGNQEQTTRNVNSNETTVESNLVSPISATQSPEVPNHETSEIPSTEDDVAARTTAESKKRSRGLTMGKGLLKYFDAKKTKIKIDVNESVGRPLDADQSAKLSSQIGVVTRDVLPVPKKWKEVDENHGLEPGFDHLKMFMDVNIDDPGVKQCLINRIKISTRNQRHKLHLHFQKYATVQEAKNNKPSFGPNKEQWEELCDYFASEKFKHVSEVNKENRSKLRYKHIAGRKAFTVKSREISLQELNGEACDVIELFARTHSKEEDGWESNEAWEKMKMKRDEYAEQGIDKSSREIMLEVLGHGTGYIKGLGYGPKPPSRRSVSYDTSSELQKKLLETQEKLVASETQVEKLKTEVSDFKNQLSMQGDQLLEQGAEITVMRDQLNKLMNVLAGKGMQL
ncbi:hypothetical protein ACS0TY_019680 [Phlomoides rotata]